jgi:hypothetical protein
LRLPAQEVDITLDDDVAFSADCDGLDLAVTDQFINLGATDAVIPENGPIGAVI